MTPFTSPTTGVAPDELSDTLIAGGVDRAVQMLISGGTVIAPDAVYSPGWVDISADRIVGCGAGLPPRAADFSFPESTLAAGYVDIHTHGGGGSSFNDADTAVAVARITATHRANGTTTMLASLVTGPIDEFEQTISALAGLVATGVLAGIHLEGPWLSPVHRGAHDENLLLVPDAESVDRLMRAGRGTVRMVGFGAVAAVWHTDANYDMTRQAIAAGATAGTHVFNAMRQIHHREPGPALALLEDPAVFAELIADGVHLHPDIVRFIIESPSRPVLVTDAMAAAGADEGDYKLGALDVRVSSGQARLADGTIAGSVLTLSAAVRYAVHTAGVPTEVAVRAATQNPADLIGLVDRGRLAAGNRADLNVLGAGLRVTATLQAGRWVTCVGD